MVDQVGAELGFQLRFGDGHANRVADALAKRARGRFDALGEVVLWMTGSLGAELAEVLDLIDRHVLVAEQIERCVKQHRAVAGGQDKAVAIGPMRILGIELHDFREQHGCHVGAAHRQARVPGICLLNRVHGERTDGIGHLVGNSCIGHEFPLTQFGRKCHVPAIWPVLQAGG